MLRLGNKNTLIGRASRALGWSFLSTVLVRLGTFGIGVILARLLGPHAFGVYAVALVAQLAVLSFNELGVSLSIVRWPGDPREVAPTVATIACVSSVILYLGFFLGAPAFAAAMGSPAATPVIRVLAIGVIIDGVVSVPAAMLQRSFRQDQKMIADQVHSWSGAAVSVGLALAGFGAMSLAVGAVVGAVAGGAVIMKFSPPPRFGFDVVKARALLVFGLPLAGSSFVLFLVANVDNFIVGHVLGATALGYYVLAWNLSSWPVTMFSMPVRAVAPAMFSRLQHDKPAMRKGFVSAVGMLSSVTLPVCLLMAGSAVPLVTFVYGARWVPAAQALTWLALLAALRIFFEFSYDFFVVLARSRVVFTVQLVWLTALIPALIIGVHKDGIRGAAIAGFAVAACLVLPWYVIELHRAAIKVGALVGQVWMPILAATGVGLLPRGLGNLFSSNLAILIVGGFVALGTIGLLLLHMKPELGSLQSASAEPSESSEVSELAELSQTSELGELNEASESSEPSEPIEPSEPVVKTAYVGRHRRAKSRPSSIYPAIRDDQHADIGEPATQPYPRPRQEDDRTAVLIPKLTRTLLADDDTLPLPIIMNRPGLRPHFVYHEGQFRGAGYVRQDEDDPTAGCAAGDHNTQ